MNRIRLLLIAVALIIIPVHALPSWRDFSFRGYIKDMASLSRVGSGLAGADSDWRFDNVIHTRQNLRWYTSRNLTGGLELKTRLFYGEDMKSTLEFADALAGQAAYFDWSWTLFDEDDLALVTTIDRAWIDWYSGPVQATVGRQRIAWGTNLVWNPIDLFNRYSPLDFDNEERPGTDGARLQYYTGSSSKLEISVAPSQESEKTIAGALIRLNRWEYDFHFVAGRKGKGSIAGGGWAGQIRGGGFRGEWLYVYPDEDSPIPDPHSTVAVSGDYTFPNSFYVLAEALYNERGTTGNAGGTHLLTAMEEGALTPARASVFGQVAYNVSVLIRGNLSGILNPYDRSWFVGPTVTWSVMSNLDLTGTGLLFGGEDGTEFGDMGEILFLRLKWSF